MMVWDTVAIAKRADGEFYTPALLVETARRIMGGIDLDPASCAEANRTVGATRFYTREENGLSQPWSGRVWLNPPFSLHQGKGLFIARIVEDYRAGVIEQAIVLTNMLVAHHWAQPLHRYAEAVALTIDRLYWNRPGPEPDSDSFGSILWGFGVDPARWQEEWRGAGLSAYRVG